MRLTSTGGSSVVSVRFPDRPQVDLALPVSPDPAMARRVTAGFRRVSWVSIDTSGDVARCEVAGVSRRPQRVGLPLAAALALADAAVPTVVRLSDRTA